MSAVRSDRLLVLVLTRRCDLRCGYCPQSFADEDMAPATLDAALTGLLPLLARPARVKLFGGEPLLRPDLVERALSRLASAAPEAVVELPTNGRRWSSVSALLERRPEVEVFLSRPDERTARLPGAVHNFLLTPGETPGAAARRLLGAIRLGLSRFNFLPAYFVRWTPVQLEGLARSFSALRRVIDARAAAGSPVEVVNLSRRGTTPLYNDGLVVDADGEVYSSNLVLARAVRPRRGRLRLGRVFDPGLVARRPPETAETVLADSFPPGVLASTRAADAALTAFCRGLERPRS